MPKVLKGRARVRPGRKLSDKEIGQVGIDETRCKAWNRRGTLEQCALDIGHYRDRMSDAPSPHVSENGEEWF